MEADPNTRTTPEDLPITLIQLLSNTLVLNQTAPHLPASSLLALGSTSKGFRNLIHNTSNVFRYLDLTKVKLAQFDIAAIDHGGEVWRNVQLDENVTEDDFYGGPLRGIFNVLQRRHILQDVQTLILDGLSVPSDLVSDIITQSQYSVRILSIREVFNLNERKLQQALKYAVRPTRPANTPKLQALYFFGPKDVVPSPRTHRNVSRYPPGSLPPQSTPSYGGVIHSQGAQIGAQWNEKSGNALAEELARGCDKWCLGSGKVLSKSPSADWVHTLAMCEGVISFDAVMCTGPRHHGVPTEFQQSSQPAWYKQQSACLEPQVATHSLKGCHGCGKTPEMFSKFGVSPLCKFPLLAPPPLYSSTIKAAKAPFMSPLDKFLARCVDCLRGRFCESCHIWWCENCYEIPSHAYAPGSPHWEGSSSASSGNPEKVKVHIHMGLCVETCLVSEMMSGAGSNGMWG